MVELNIFFIKRCETPSQSIWFIGGSNLGTESNVSKCHDLSSDDENDNDNRIKNSYDKILEEKHVSNENNATTVKF